MAVNNNRTIKAVVLTISDSASRGEREDLSGPAVVSELQSLGAEIVATEILPDEREVIAARLRHHSGAGAGAGADAVAGAGSANLILTTGGTGLGPRDITPEATRDVIEREAPGLAELMRAESVKITPLGALSRSVCGARGRTLIVNLPGSVRGARENLQAIARLLPHAVSLLGE